MLELASTLEELLLKLLGEQWKKKNMHNLDFTIHSQTQVRVLLLSVFCASQFVLASKVVETGRLS